MAEKNDGSQASSSTSVSVPLSVMPALEPPAAVLEPCATHIAAANAALARLEAELEGAENDGTAAALDAVNDAAAELRAAFAFIDQLEESVAAAGLLVEATERRLEVFERGERLPDSLATLPPAMFTNHQFTRQVRRREKAAPPDLPELTLLPPSRAETAEAERAAAAAVVPEWAPLPPEVDELQRIAEAAAATAATAASNNLAFAREQASRQAAILADQAPQLMAAADVAAASLASAREQAAQQAAILADKAPELVAAAERAREKARELFKSTSGWSSGFWGSK